MTELPNGWVETVLDEIAATSLGKMLDAKQRTGLHQTPYLRNVNVRWGTFDLSDVATMDIEPHELNRVLAQPGDLVVCEGGEPGRSAVWRATEAVALQKALHKIRPAAGVLPDYLGLLLREQASTGELDKLFTGTTIKHLPQERLRLVRVPLPPTSEQERIVVAIDEAFSKVDAGEAGLRTVRRLVKRMRDAVLAAAVTGRLVPQDPTDTPAAKLLADLGVSPMAGQDLPLLPSGWAWAQLGSLAHDKGYGTSIKCSYDDSGAGVLRIPNVQRGSIDLSNLKRVPRGADLDDRLFLRPGDLLIVRTNGSRDLIGRCAPVTRDVHCAFASYLIRFRLDLSQINVEYGSMMLSSPWWRSRLEHAAASSAGQYNLSLRSLEPMPVALPPLPEQDRIVSEVDRQLSGLVAAERAMEAGVALSRGLRRSVLKAAFEGRLVPQDPADEPAPVLLARIREERAAAPKPAGRSRRMA